MRRYVTLMAMGLGLTLAVSAYGAPAPAKKLRLPAPSREIPAPSREIPEPKTELPLPSLSLPNPSLDNAYLPAQIVVIPTIPTFNHRIRLALEMFGGSPSFGVLDFMMPMAANPQALLYAGLRGLIATSNNGLTNKTTKNVTFELGYRQILHDAYILGGYVMLDRQLTGLDHYFTQLNPGFEYLSRSWALRANGYIPIGKTQSFLGVGFGLPGSVPALQGHTITLEEFINNEIAAGGFDVELGRALPSVPRLQGYVGYAHYFSRAGSAVINGARLRIDYLLGNYTQLELRDAYDHIFGNRLYLGVRFILGGNAGLAAPNDLEWQMTSFPIRARGVAALPQALPQGTRVVNSNVFYVNSAAAAGGDGTFERPFTTMAAALAAAAGISDAIIYVYRGTGATYTTAATTLTGNQILTGQGGDWFYDGVLLLPGSNALRPTLSLTGTLTLSGTGNVIENNALANGGAGTGVSVTGTNAVLRNMVVGTDTAGFITGVLVGAGASATVANSTVQGIGAAGLISGVQATAGGQATIIDSNVTAIATGTGIVIPVAVVAFGASTISMTGGSANASNFAGGGFLGLSSISVFGAAGSTVTLNNVAVNAASSSAVNSATGVSTAGAMNLSNITIQATGAGGGPAIAINVGATGIVNAANNTINAATTGAVSSVTITAGGVFNNNGGNVCIENGIVVACP